MSSQLRQEKTLACFPENTYMFSKKHHSVSQKTCTCFSEIGYQSFTKWKFVSNLL